MVPLGVVMFPTPDWLELEMKSIIISLSLLYTVLFVIISPLLAMGPGDI